MTRKANVKENAKRIGIRTRANEKAAFEAGVKACLGDRAPLGTLGFPVKLAIIYYTPETHIGQFIENKDAINKVCETTLTKDCDKLFDLVRDRLRKSGLQKEAQILVCEYAKHINSKSGSCVYDENLGPVTGPTPELKPDSINPCITGSGENHRSSRNDGASTAMETRVCALYDNGQVNGSSNSVSDEVHTFCTKMGAVIDDPIDVKCWTRFFLATGITANEETEIDDGPENAAQPLGHVEFGILLRQIESLNPGKLSIIDLTAIVRSVRVRHQGIGKVVFSLAQGQNWAIVTIDENHSRATIYLPELHDTRKKSRGSGMARSAIAGEFNKAYRELFGPRTLPQQHFESAVVAEHRLCYLLTAFAAAMDVVIATPCRGRWYKLFHRMAQTNAPAPHVLWVGIPAVDKIEEAAHISVPLCYSDLNLSGRDSFHCVSEDVVRLLEVALGSSFIQHLDDDNFVIHQSVLMMLFACRFSSGAIEFCSCPPVAEDLIRLIQMINPSRLVVFVSDSGFRSGDTTWDRLFEALRFFDGADFDLCVYPSQEELAWSRHKLGDIRTFNTIAQTKQHWRPKTCFGVGDCTLPDLSQAIKRNHSCAAEHVKIVTTRDGDQLKCIVASEGKPRASNRITKGEQPGYIYFHQEEIQTFQTFGEFRVFVSAGKVTSILRTKFKWDSPNKDISAWKVQLEDFKWYSSDEAGQRQKRQELEEFVLGLDEHIRQQQKPGFETIHVGGRYDCGITKESPDGEFFVSELTRLFSADTFPRCYQFVEKGVLIAWAEALMQLVKDN